MTLVKGLDVPPAFKLVYNAFLHYQENSLAYNLKSYGNVQFSVRALRKVMTDLWAAL